MCATKNSHVYCKSSIRHTWWVDDWLINKISMDKLPVQPRTLCINRVAYEFFKNMDQNEFFEMAYNSK